MRLYDELDIEMKLNRKIRFMAILIVLLFLLSILGHFKIYSLGKRATDLENTVLILLEKG